MKRLKQLVSPPVFEDDEEKTRAAAVLNSLQLAIGLAVFLGEVAAATVFAEKVGSLIVISAYGGILTASRILLFRGNVRQGSYLVVASLWVGITGVTILSGGMTSINAVYYIFLTVISGLLFGPKITIVMAVINALTGFLMALSTELGYPPPQFFPLLPMAGWINLCFSIFLVVVTLNIALNSLHNALSLARRRLEEREDAEAALAANQKHLRQLLSVNPAVVYAATIDGDSLNTVFLSENVEERLGYSVGEILCNPNFWIEHAHPDDAQKTLTRVRQILEENYITLEYRFRHYDGTYRWIHDEMQLVQDDLGRSPKIVGSWYDVTERKQVEKEAENTRAMLVAAFEQSPIPMAMISAPDMIVRIINSATRDILGMQEGGGLTGKHLAKLDRTWQRFYPDNTPMPEKESPLQHALQGATIKNKEHYVLREDGQKRWVLVSAAPIYNKSAEIIAALLVFLDITEQKQAEAERERLLTRIQEQARQVRQIINTVPDDVLLLDAEKRILLANQSGERDLQTLAKAQVGEILTYLGPYSTDELLIPPAHGLWRDIHLETRRFQSTARPIETGEESQGWLLILHDVTQQYEFEQRIQQQERLATVGQLAAGIAHDFNNIMATIVLYSQMSKRISEVPERVQKWMDIIHQQALHATRLTQQILDFSRRAILKRIPMDLLALLQEQIQVLKRTLPEHIQIQLTYDPGEYTIEGSVTSIQQVFLNLALNARDAMPQGGTLSFAMRPLHIGDTSQAALPEMPPGEWIWISVTDSGSGIDADILPHIFDPFFTTKEPGKGTGLGLAQVHGIIGMHEGHIDVASEVGHGTTFELYLPAIVTKAPTKKNAAFEYTLGDGQTILVVEDNAVTRQALVESLETLNYRVEIAAHGREAMAKLEETKNNIALILSDVLMPEMGGVALLQEMQRRNIAVPVILLTGHPLETELEQLSAQENPKLLTTWLQKPPDMVTLSQAIAHALKSADGISLDL